MNKNKITNQYPPERPEDIKLFHTDQITIAYQYIVNDPAYETIIFFYGFDGSICQMEILLPHISNYNILLADYPGHCYSPISHLSPEKQLKEYQKALEGIIEKLGIQTYHLIGYSFGGIMALEFYLRNKSKIKSFVFFNSSVNFRYNWFQKFFYTCFEFFISLNFNFVIPYLAIPLLTDRYFNEELMNTSREVSLYNDPQSVLNQFHITIRKNLDSRLNEIECPVYLLGSKKDILVLPGTIHKMAQKTPQCEVHIEQKFGHITFASRPEDVAKLISNFLDQYKKKWSN
ncbi:MAG: alpha/beta hydrolase [Spirochaetes bacterium]|nr:alpha/beta hydrolase [Spirochaetota bacterium]